MLHGHFFKNNVADVRIKALCRSGVSRKNKESEKYINFRTETIVGKSVVYLQHFLKNFKIVLDIER